MPFCSCIDDSDEEERREPLLYLSHLCNRIFREQEQRGFFVAGAIPLRFISIPVLPRSAAILCFITAAEFPISDPHSPL